MKCIKKVKINSKYQRKFDTPKTPYQRVLDCLDIPNCKQELLKKEHETLNPFKLKRIIDKKLKRIFSTVIICYVLLEISAMKFAPRFYNVFIPFVLLLISLTMACSFINWIIFIKSEIFVTYPFIVYLIIPMVLSSISVMLWLPSRRYRATLSLEEQEQFKIFKIIAVILLTAVIYFTQLLLEDKLTRVVKLQDIIELYDQKPSKFFSAKEYTVEKYRVGTYYSQTEHHDKGRITYCMDLFFAFPIFSKKQQAPVIWAGIQFNKTIETNHREGAEEIKKEFIFAAFEKIQAMPLKKFYYFELMRDDFINFGFEEAAKNSPMPPSKNYYVLRGGELPLKDKLTEDMANFIVVLAISLIIWSALVALLISDEKEIPDH